MEGIEEYLEQIARDKKELKTMSISEIKYVVTYKGQTYSLYITPKGKGYYDVKCIVGLRTMTMNDYFSHSISMSKAKDLTLIFHTYLNQL